MLRQPSIETLSDIFSQVILAPHIIYQLAIDIVDAENAAIQKTKEAELKAFLSGDHCVDERIDNVDRPAVGKLIMNGHDRAAELLIYKFGANVVHAIHAYAKLNNFVLIKKYLHDYPTPFAFKLALSGAAEVDGVELMALIIGMARNYSKRTYIDIKKIISGAFISVKRFNAHHCLDMLSKKYLVSQRIQITLQAMDGNFNQIIDLLNRFPDKNYYEDAASGFLYGNHITELKKLIELYPDIVDGMVADAAYEGRYEFVNEFIHLPQHRRTAIKAYAIMGCIARVNELKNSDDMNNEILDGLIDGEHYRLAEKMMVAGVALAHQKLKFFTYHEKLKMFVFTQTKEARLALRAATPYEGKEYVVRMSDRIRQMMAKYDIDMQQAQYLIKPIKRQVVTLMDEQGYSFLHARALVETPHLTTWLAMQKQTSYHGSLAGDVVSMIISYKASMPVFDAEKFRVEHAPMTFSPGVPMLPSVPISSRRLTPIMRRKYKSAGSHGATLFSSVASKVSPAISKRKCERQIKSRKK